MLKELRLLETTRIKMLGLVFDHRIHFSLYLFSREKYVIDLDMEQVWEDEYYYPTIPNVNEFGVISGSIPTNRLFGSKEVWNEDDVNAPITNRNEMDENLIMNINFEQTTTDNLEDSIGLFKVNYNQDYVIGFDENFRIGKKSIDIPDALEKNKTKQVF